MEGSDRTDRKIGGAKVEIWTEPDRDPGLSLVLGNTYVHVLCNDGHVGKL